MRKEVLHLREVDDESFDDVLNERIESYEKSGWELVDTQLSTDYDPELQRTYSTALLTFEK